jgi:hypothetical protein
MVSVDPVNVMFVIGILGIVGMIVGIAFFPQNPDHGPDIKKNLGIVAITTAILIGIFGGAAYMYFNANLNSLPTFLLVMSFINLFLSTLAVSASSLQITYS